MSGRLNAPLAAPEANRFHLSEPTPPRRQRTAPCCRPGSPAFGLTPVTALRFLQYAFNLFSHTTKIGENGYNEEEMKMVKETRKIWGVRFTACRLARSSHAALALHLSCHSAVFFRGFWNADDD